MYRITAILKVETDIITCNIGMTCYDSDSVCRDLQTDVIIFIGNVIMCWTSHSPIISKYQIQFNNTDNITKITNILNNCFTVPGTRSIPPKFINPLSDQVLTVGDKLVLQAKVTGKYT